jgi:hypothetical protein
MKKVLSLAFIAAVFLFGCSADGFYDQDNPNKIVWSKVCKIGDNICVSVSTKKACDDAEGKLVTRSQCPD